MTINVYWACAEDEWARAEPPVEISKHFLGQEKVTETGAKFCPALRSQLNNLYGLKSIYNYEFDVHTDRLTSTMYDDQFFDKHVHLRSHPHKMFSFFQEFIFFTDRPSLLMTGNLMPYMEDNNITERTIPIPGCFDIGQWFRVVEFGFYLRENFNQFKITEGEIYQYIRFHTDEKINFKQFYFHDDIKKLNNAGMDCRKHKKIVTNLQFYYQKFRYKKLLLKRIKENLL